MILPSKEDQPQQQRGHYCPLHSPRLLQGVWESSIEEDYEEEDPNQAVKELEEASSSPSITSQVKVKGPKKSYVGNQELLAAVAAIYTNRDKNRLGLSGFVPRKLSTISSRSCSVNPENDGPTDSTADVHVPQVADGASPVSPSQESVANKSHEFLNEVKSVEPDGGRSTPKLSKSDHQLYDKNRTKNSDKSMVRVTVTPDTTISSAATFQRATSDVTPSSIETIEGCSGVERQPIQPTGLVIQSPDNRQIQVSAASHEKELDEDDSSEMDPLMQ